MIGAMGSGISTSILTLAGAVAVAFFVFSLNRGAKMRDDGRFLAASLWYSGGAIPLAGICLMWTSTGDQLVMLQRILLFTLGATIGGFALLAVGEAIRPTSPVSAQQVEPGTMSNGKNSVSISGSNNNVTIGHIGDVTITQTPRPELKLETAKVQKEQDGTYT